MPKNITLTIDDTSVTVPEGTLLVEAAKTIDTDVPVYCYHPKLGPAGLCRICLVEIEKMPKLQIACNTVVAQGMVVHTYGDKVADGRRAVMEFLLLNHPLDCPICDKGGECDLQDYSMAYGQSASRLADAKSSKPKATDLGPTIVLDDERCIVCQRCSRFDDIITREESLVVKDRGQRDVIATATGEPYRSNFSGNVTELCPVGALTSKTYRFKSRPWNNNRTATTCTQCSVGCQLYVDVRYGDVARTMSMQHDDAISDGWLCDRGRYNIGFYSDARRLTSPLLRQGEQWVQIDWDDAIALWATQLRDAMTSAGAGTIGVIGGGRLLNEETILLERTMRGLGVENLDWRAGRQRRATPGRHAGSYQDLERAQAIVAIGRPPSQTAPVLDLRIRKAVSRGGARFVTVGLHAGGSFVPSLNVRTIEELGPLLDGAARVAFIWDGDDIELGQRAGTFVDALVGQGVEVRTFITGEQSNARGADAFGLLPRAGGLPVESMLAAAQNGALRVLSLFGVNPVLYHPRGAAAVSAAIANVPFVAVTDLFLTETAQLADLVLPARGGFEKNGHVYDLAGDLLSVHQAHVAPDGTLSDGEMLVALAAELDVDVPAPDELIAAATAPLVAATHGFGDRAFSDGVATANVDGAAAHTGVAATADTGGAVAAVADRAAVAGADGGPPAAATSGGLRIAVATDVFAGGGTVRFDDQLADLRPIPTATFAPATAQANGVRAGDALDVMSSDGRLLQNLVARVDPDALPAIVTVLDGLSAAPANAFRDGDEVAIANVRAPSDGVLVGGLA